MRKLIRVPMIHSQEALARQAGKVSQRIAAASSERVAGVSQKFWDVVETKLSTLNPINAKFYLEGYSGDPIIVAPGTTNFPIERPDPVPEERIITDFIKRVGGTIERTEDADLMKETFET